MATNRYICVDYDKLIKSANALSTIYTDVNASILNNVTDMLNDLYQNHDIAQVDIDRDKNNINNIRDQIQELWNYVASAVSCYSNTESAIGNNLSLNTQNGIFASVESMPHSIVPQKNAVLDMAKFATFIQESNFYTPEEKSDILNNDTKILASVNEFINNLSDEEKSQIKNLQEGTNTAISKYAVSSITAEDAIKDTGAVKTTKAASILLDNPILLGIDLVGFTNFLKSNPVEGKYAYSTEGYRQELITKLKQQFPNYNDKTIEKYVDLYLESDQKLKIEDTSNSGSSNNETNTTNNSGNTPSSTTTNNNATSYTTNSNSGSSSNNTSYESTSGGSAIKYRVESSSSTSTEVQQKVEQPSSNSESNQSSSENTNSNKNENSNQQKPSEGNNSEADKGNNNQQKPSEGNNSGTDKGNNNQQKPSEGNNSETDKGNNNQQKPSEGNDTDSNTDTKPASPDSDNSTEIDSENKNESVNNPPTNTNTSNSTGNSNSNNYGNSRPTIIPNPDTGNSNASTTTPSAPDSDAGIIDNSGETLDVISIDKGTNKTQPSTSNDGARVIPIVLGVGAAGAAAVAGAKFIHDKKEKENTYIYDEDSNEESNSSAYEIKDDEPVDNDIFDNGIQQNSKYKAGNLNKLILDEAPENLNIENNIPDTDSKEELE